MSSSSSSSSSSRKSIRLVYPQWQGGNNAPYYFGAQMLAWLAPQNIDAKHIFTVPVHRPDEVPPLTVDGNVTGRQEVLRNLQGALAILEREQPDSVVVFGGDCGVSLAPFSYLSSRYKDETFGVLWIDSHPDVTAGVLGFPNSHMHVLANVMGHGDGDLTAAVKDPVPSAKVLLAGVHSALPHEYAFLQKHRITALAPETVRKDGARRIVDWIKREGITRLAVHLDFDVLDPAFVKSLIFTKPHAPPNYMEGVAQGTLELKDVADIMAAVGKATEVVGFTFAEFFPWDAINLKRLLEQLPLVGSGSNDTQSKL